MHLPTDRVLCTHSLSVLVGELGWPLRRLVRELSSFLGIISIMQPHGHRMKKIYGSPEESQTLLKGGISCIKPSVNIENKSNQH